MASDLNRVVLIGRLTRDAELRYTPSGTGVANFSLANNRTYVADGEKKEDVSYFDCIAWSKLGEIITEYCKKGQKIAVEGRLQQRRWDDQEGNKRSKIEMVVENFQFISAKDIQSDANTVEKAFSGIKVDENPFSDSDEIPF